MRPPSARIRCALLCAVVGGFAAAGLSVSRVAAAEEAWSRFRGPDGSGVTETAFPTSWTEPDWQVQLPGTGHSSPVVWGDRVFVTAGSDDGSRRLVALEAATGQTIWTQTIQLAPTHLHAKNSLASGSPACDDERVYVPVASADEVIVAAYGHDGQPRWRSSLGSYESQHGPGSSPIVHGELVIMPSDQIGSSAITALDRRTGQTVWTSPRMSRRAAYATPRPLPGHPHVLVCLSGAEGVTGIDAADGRKLFRSGEVPLRVVASPAIVGGKVIITCGSGGSGKYMAAIEPTAQSGDDGSWTLRTVWERRQSIPYVPTPVARNGDLFFWNDNGVVCCVAPETGQDRWKVRVGDKYSGSPIIAGGRLYAISENGRVAVVDAAAESPTIHEGGRIPSGSHATPAIGAGRMFLRGFDTLTAIAAKTAE